MKEQSKCLSVNLPLRKVDKIKKIKELTGKSQSEILTESVMAGIKILQPNSKKMFWVKVRIDASKMMVLGQKLQSGELDNKMIKLTYCIKEDPTVGISLWEADSREEFEMLFAPHKEYYKEVIEVVEAVKPEEAMALILEEMKK